MPNPHYFACVLAGGSGERFWPMSRTRTPKHLLKLLSDRTLIEETVRRLEGVVRPENLLVLTSAAQEEGVRAALPFLSPAQIVAEPARRDTAPAAALATGWVHARDPLGVVALLPADAFIHDRRRFAAQLRDAFDLAAGTGWEAPAGVLLTFGVRPTRPETGFGYLELGDPIVATPPAPGFHRVRRFVEKPDAPKAQAYVASGQYLWNAGMFVWRTTAFLAETERHEPALAAFIRDFPAGDPAAYLSARFAALPKASVDYAVLEKAAAVATLIADFDWSDVGSWTAVPDHLPPDGAGNTVRGAVAAVDATNNIVISNGRMIALCGVKDLVVVETADAVLVCHRDAVQNIKKLHPLLPKEIL